MSWWIVHQVNQAQEMFDVLKKIGYPNDYDHCYAKNEYIHSGKDNIPIT